MPRNVYSEINLHLTWHTKQNARVLTAEIEGRLDHYLQHRAPSEGARGVGVRRGFAYPAWPFERARCAWRKRPVYECGDAMIASGVPWAMIWPPMSPPSGPRSMM